MDSSDDFVYDPDALDYDYDDEEIEEMRKPGFASTCIPGLVYLKKGEEMENTRTRNGHKSVDTEVSGQPKDANNVVASTSEINDEEGSKVEPSPKRTKLAHEPDAESVDVDMETKNEADKAVTPSNIEENYSTEVELFGVTSTKDVKMPHLVAIRTRRGRSRSRTCTCCENYGKPPKLFLYL